MDKLGGLFFDMYYKDTMMLSGELLRSDRRSDKTGSSI